MPNTHATAPPATARVPVTIRIGDREITLGRMTAHGDPAELPAEQVGHLLRVAAELVDGSRHDWPRQRWCVGDRVELPNSSALGRVAQVDSRTKEYLLDLGTLGVRRVWWGLIDDPDLDVDPN